LLAGLELGRLIRRSGLHTYVAPTGNGCYSTCVYAFAGGAVRTYDGRPPLGVHQFRDGNSESSAQTALAIVAEYLDEMGIDHRLLEAASLVPPENMQTIPVGVARQWRLDNSHVSITQTAASLGQSLASNAGCPGRPVHGHRSLSSARRVCRAWREAGKGVDGSRPHSPLGYFAI
jgi:hypothetical protein